MSRASHVIMPIKFMLMIWQFILVVLIAATGDEYIFAGISSQHEFGSSQYSRAQASLLIACLIFIILLILEFLTLLAGISLLFDKVNCFQIVFHFLGCLVSIWQILDGFQYKTVWSILGFFGIPPFLLEVGVIFAAIYQYRIVSQVEDMQRRLEKEAQNRQKAHLEQQDLDHYLPKGLQNQSQQQR